jgi:hypothetical protein
MTRSLPFAAALLLLAACSDSTTAPAPVAAPTSAPEPRASADLIGGPIVRDAGITVKLLVSSQGGGVVDGTTVEFKTNTGNTKSVADNSASDADARAGYFSVQMPKAASYTATVTVYSDVYAPDGTSKTVSYWNSPTLVDMGYISLKFKPAFVITMRYQGAVITGQTLNISAGPDFSKTITDGGPSDKDFSGNQSPADGIVYVRVPHIGNYYMCAVTAPNWQWGGCQQAWALQYWNSYGVFYDYQKVWADIPKLP